MHKIITSNWNKVKGLLLGLQKENNTRIMTLHPKVNFIITHILNKAIYISRILPCPKEIAEAIEKYIGLERFCRKNKDINIIPPTRRGKTWIISSRKQFQMSLH